MVEALTHKVLLSLVFRFLILIFLLVEVDIAEFIDVLVETHNNLVLLFVVASFDRFLLF